MSKRPSNAKIIEVLEKCHGLVKPSAVALGVTRKTLYEWLDKDEELKEVQFHCKESLIDLAESRLYQNIQDGDTTSVIFALKTVGRGRGYYEKSELDSSGGVEIKIIRE